MSLREHVASPARNMLVFCAYIFKGITAFQKYCCYGVVRVLFVHDILTSHQRNHSNDLLYLFGQVDPETLAGAVAIRKYVCCAREDYIHDKNMFVCAAQMRLYQKNFNEHTR